MVPSMFSIEGALSHLTKPVGLPEPIQPEQDSVLMVMFTIPFTPGPDTWHVTSYT